jgi:hypothetical protein
VPKEIGLIGGIGPIRYEPNVKQDDGKAPMGDLDLTVLRVVAAVYGHGNKKYATDNHLNPSTASVRRYVGACLRHLEARQRGEMLDPESNMPHLAHAICSLMIALRHDGLPALEGFWK